MPSAEALAAASLRGSCVCALGGPLSPLALPCSGGQVVTRSQAGVQPGAGVGGPGLLSDQLAVGLACPFSFLGLSFPGALWLPECLPFPPGTLVFFP